MVLKFIPRPPDGTGARGCPPVWVFRVLQALLLHVGNWGLRPTRPPV